MKYNKLEYYISQTRLDRFLNAAGNSKAKAQNLYRINLRVSQAFYPILNLFEIFLRNTFNYQISEHFNNSNWIMTEKNGFMNDSSLYRSAHYLKNSVIRAESSIKNNGGTVTSGKIIAEQSLGFWTSLFDVHHYRLIGGVVIHSFSNKPHNANRRIISKKLNRIRKFRNRIDFTDALNIQKEVYELLNWIDTDLSEYVNYFNNINVEINAASNL